MRDKALKFGDLLRQLRQEVGLTMGALAREVGISTSYVSDVERNLRAPFSAGKLEDVIDLLRMHGASEEKTRDLFVLATEARSQIKIPVSGLSAGQRQVLLGLAKRLGALTSEQLDEIVSVLNKPNGEPDGGAQ